jgi:CheY-like chemotaxis protein
VIHELMTNSAKYGGLSDNGHVEVRWSIDSQGCLALDWQEIGGPVVQPPTRQGFGSTIIRRSIPYDLGGEAKIEFAPLGLSAHFVIPERHVSQRVPPRTTAAPEAEAPPTSLPSGTLLSGPVLLVEDSLIIAMDAEDILVRLGAETVATASTVPQALSELGHVRPIVAILDINLGTETSLPIADRLKTLGVPFLFATGYGEQTKLPPAHSDTPVLQKPYTIEGVARGLAALLNPA